MIHDKHGKQVLTTRTPATVELRRKDKFIWPAKYTATIEKPGYKTATVPINQSVNPWVIGNVVVGGVIGLAIDNATGAAWKPKVASIDQQLEPVYVAQQPTAYPAGDSDAAADVSGGDGDKAGRATGNSGLLAGRERGGLSISALWRIGTKPKSSRETCCQVCYLESRRLY